MNISSFGRRWIQLPSALTALTTVLGAREVLTAARTYYVRTDGSNSNDGLSNTSGGAFLTVQKAIDTAASLDCSTSNVTINVADGTYTGALTLRQMLGSGTFSIVGNTTTPANVLMNITSANAVTASDVGAWTLDGMKLQTTTSGVGISAAGRSTITIRRIDFGTMAGAQHISAVSGSRVLANGTTLTLSGGPTFAVWSTQTGAVIECFSTTTTVTASFTVNRFADAALTGVINSGSATFSLGAFTITGTRYIAATNAVINTGGGGASYFPGTVAGSTATGGQYT